jgi:hypothetical protein
MKKFELVLGRNGDTVMKDRASNITKLAEMAQTAMVNGLEKRKIELEMEKTALLDMSPDNRYSLKPGADFKADNWVNDYQHVSVELINIEIELKVAQATNLDLFSDGPEETAD